MSSPVLGWLFDGDAADAMDSVLVTRHDKIVAGAYCAPYRAGLLHSVNSVTMAVIGTLAGLASNEEVLVRHARSPAPSTANGERPPSRPLLGRMAEAAVYGLEAVQVDIQQCKRGARACDPHERLIQKLFEESAIRQLGKSKLLATAADWSWQTHRTTRIRFNSGRIRSARACRRLALSTPAAAGTGCRQYAACHGRGGGGGAAIQGETAIGKRFVEPIAHRRSERSLEDECDPEQRVRGTVD